MITDLTSSPLRPRQRGARLMVLLGLAGMASLSAQAAAPGLSGVDPGDTFSVDAVGYSQADPSAAVSLSSVDATFDTTETFSDAAPGGQSLTVISTEGTSNGVTTDSVFVTVPNNFVTGDTVDKDGNTIDALVFSIGDSDTLDFTSAPNPSFIGGAITFTYDGMSESEGQAQSPMFTNAGTSFSDSENPTTDPGTPISSYDITGFSFTIAYSAVPEPSTVATMLFGGAGLVWLATRRRQVGA